MIDLKLIRLITGEEIIAEVVDWKNGILTVKNGLTVIPHADQVGFAPWATVIDKENPEITVSRNHIVYIVPVIANIAVAERREKHRICKENPINIISIGQIGKYTTRLVILQNYIFYIYLCLCVCFCV